MPVVKYVSKTGRALTPGTVTRASTLLRSSARHQEKPLPIDLQCHPKKLTPTPVNPECYTYTRQYGMANSLAHALTREQISNGHGLQSDPARFEVCHGDKVVGYTEDASYGLAYVLAAKMMGFITFQLNEVQS